MMKNIYLILLSLMAMGLEAQVLPPVPETRTCATMEQDSINRMKYPGWGSLDELEIAIQERVSAMERSSAARTEVVVTIPVIFHIVHNGESVGSGTNLAAERISAQLEVLNQDFRRIFNTPGYNDHPDGADIEIEFCAATVDPNGVLLSEAGIHRYNGGQAGYSRQEAEQLKALTIWNPNLYYNVWSLNFEGADNLLLGYAQFPSNSNLNGLPTSGGPASTDGVVLRYTVVGNQQAGMQEPYNRGRTLTHETGHWLGLRHIWGDGACNADDFCDDTPFADSENRGCPIGTVSCGSIDMVENYMDYTNDACMNIFTQDQKARILAVMSLSPRRGILTSSTVCGTLNQDPPVANFTADKTQVLLGGRVNYTDLSANFPTTWSWNFEGGDPVTSNERNPSVIYNTPGTYRVSLIAANVNGTSPEFVVEDYITVSSEGLCNTLSNFEGGTETLLTVPESGTTGYIAGHNSLMHQAKSEYFENQLGYVELSGALINFGYAYSEDIDATAKVVVWNALGPQNAPARIIEEKRVLIRRIKEDIAANRPTQVNFDRKVPIFLGTAFHIGVELEYNGDTVAITTTADGEATKQTSWEKNGQGEWIPYALSWGLDVSHDITAIVGMNPSVHIASSSESVFKGQDVTLNASGASIFTWSSDDGEIIDQLGASLAVNPRKTTTYTVTGSGLELCREEVSVTIYVKDSPLSAKEVEDMELNLFPNPVSDRLKLTLNGASPGTATITILNSIGVVQLRKTIPKTDSSLIAEIDTGGLPGGVYILRMKIGDEVLTKRFLKR